MEEERDITVILAGRKKSGKSTLLCNLGNEDPAKAAVVSTKLHVEKDGYTFHLIETTNLQQPASRDLNNKRFVLIYCMPVNPGQKFQDGNPQAMKCLQNAYGKGIWKHCIVAFTLSDLAWGHIRFSTSDRVATYKNYLEECLEYFRNELSTSLKVDTCTKTILSLQDSCSENLDQNTLLGIPTGFKPENQLLLETSLNDPSWKDRLFEEIRKKSSAAKDVKLSMPWPLGCGKIGRIAALTILINILYFWWKTRPVTEADTLPKDHMQALPYL